MAPKDEVLQHIDKLVLTGKELDASYTMEGGIYYSREPEERFLAFVTSAIATISRAAGEDSEYYRAIPRDGLAGEFANAGYSKSFIPTVIGALQSLRDAVDNGYLTSLEARLRANVHDDFLLQANDLLGAGFHVAAIVLAGGVLENHLLKLVSARNLTWAGNGSTVWRDDGY